MAPGPADDAVEAQVAAFGREIDSLVIDQEELDAEVETLFGILISREVSLQPQLATEALSSLLTRCGAPYARLVIGQLAPALGRYFFLGAESYDIARLQEIYARIAFTIRALDLNHDPNTEGTFQ